METNATFTVEVSKLDNNRFQPRKKLSTASIVELANSIRELGLLHPICVRQLGDRWQIIAGHRRVAAYRLLAESAADEETRKKYSFIRAEVRSDLSDAEVLRVCLAENLQRDNLQPLEAADGLSQLQRLDSGLTNNRALGEAVGISHTYARQLLQLASAPPYLKALLADGAANSDQEAGGEEPPWKLAPKAVLELVRGHESLASIPGLVNPQAFATRRIRAVMHRAIARQWSARDVRKAIDKLAGEGSTAKKVPPAGDRPVKEPAAPRLNAENRTEASAPPSSTAATPVPSIKAPLPVPAKKSAWSVESAWEVLVLGVVVSIVGGFLRPAIVSTVVTWVGTAISLSGIALLVRSWAPLHDAWTKAFELGVRPLWRELMRTHLEGEVPSRAGHSEVEKSSKPRSPRGKKAA